MHSVMESNGKDTNTTPTALQSASVSATRPKLIIGGGFIIVLIVILMEIYAPRQKTDAPEASAQMETSTVPAEIEYPGDRVVDENP